MTNEQLATKLSELIDKGVETIPPYIADLIDRYATYAICMNGLGVVVFGGTSIAILIIIYKKFKEYIEKDYGCLICLYGTILFFMIIFAISCTIDLFKAIFVPEVLLLELI